MPLQDVEVSQVGVVGKIPVRVVLGQLIQIFCVVQLLLCIHSAQVLQHHTVLVEVAVVGLLIQRRNDVV